MLITVRLKFRSRLLSCVLSSPGSCVDVDFHVLPRFTSSRGIFEHSCYFGGHAGIDQTMMAVEAAPGGRESGGAVVQ
ncbi:hypothetical protein V8C43DRAFT_291667 [Trichoderma afarasin]